MGCDIHAYVEYMHERANEWWFLAEFNLDRCYLMFGLMAEGVRRDFAEAIEAKGLPKKSSYQVDGKNTLYITDDGAGDGECSLSDALKWKGEIEYQDGKPVKTVHPDWHSHSWLTVGEFQNALLIANRKSERFNPADYNAALASMQAVEKTGLKARLVFWFDN